MTETNQIPGAIAASTMSTVDGGPELVQLLDP